MASEVDCKPPRGGDFEFKRKKKSNNRRQFLKNAKGFGRKQSYGHGAELAPEEYQYFLEIFQTISKLEDNEERTTMATNVYEQVQGKEIKTASNQLSCRVLEELLGYADEETLQRVMDVFAENFRSMCCDRFASYVLQKMLLVAVLRHVAPLVEQQAEISEGEPGTVPEKKSKKNTSNLERECDYGLKETFSEDHREACGKFVKRMAKFMANNLEEFVWDSAGNYVIRQCMLNLAGIIETKTTKGETKLLMKVAVPIKWNKLLAEFSARLLLWPQFSELTGAEITSVLLQDLLRALATLSDLTHLQKISEKLVNDCFNGDDEDTKKLTLDKDGQVLELHSEMLPKPFDNNASTRLLETLLSVSEPKFFKDQLFKRLFQGKFIKLSLSRAANFSVQKVLDHNTDKHILECIFLELEGQLAEIIRSGHTGIIVSLAKACARLSSQQGKFIKLLLESLQSHEANGEKLLMSVLCLLPPKVIAEQERPFIHLHGSIVLQNILEFNKPIKFVTAILETSNDKLAKIFSNPKGSFVANAFIASRFVGEKSREKLVRHLDGCYSELVLSCHGSRVLELLYEAGNPAQRENIVKELAERVTQLNSTQWGTIINQKLLVDTYKRNPTQWRTAIKSGNKLGRLFEKIIDDKEGPSSSKKRKH